jgi:CheY-like chemotaxis protein
VVLRCLLVDDNEEFLDSASRLLSAQGLEVVGRATSGADALRLAQTLGPDVALVDVQLGDEDGLELTRRLAANGRETRIILISTHAENELAELIVGNPAVGFLPKAALGADAIAEMLANAPPGTSQRRAHGDGHLRSSGDEAS